MTQIGVLALMVLCAMLPFAGLTWVMRSGRSGLALALISVIGAALVILLYASGRPFGIDPVVAMTVALMGYVPAFLGSMAGALLGWLLRRQDDRNI